MSSGDDDDNTMVPQIAVVLIVQCCVSDRKFVEANVLALFITSVFLSYFHFIIVICYVLTIDRLQNSADDNASYKC